MIVPDVNLLVYAYNSGCSFHPQARQWFETVLNGDEEVGLPWVVLMGFVRLLSSPRVVPVPADPRRLLGIVQEWLSLPVCRLIGPGRNHPALMAQLFEVSGANHRLLTDIHIAALTIEHKATLYSNDVDFYRFTKVPHFKLRNPLG
ncbi:MAG: PIN domain-containing protein [Treponemataceae bacterium]|nr:PIN domain-containing protein [Treponemataceae bacterium]HOK00111.1 PIN domain-containing protein [Termitinemataceae bacterium]HOM24336.1 PIN domain-containing protein [Termitinemataceae bacterium]HPQ01446.1 PIN domain-containing protein [Termitinemataceae bacterium]